MNRVEWIEFLLTGGEKPHVKGVVLSRAQVDEIFASGKKNLTAITFRDDLENEMEFFTNNHIFGYPKLGSDFCSCSMSLPLRCVPREGCEDGIINSYEKYAAVHKRTLTIWSMDELIDFLASRHMVEGEEPKLQPWPRK